MSVTMADPLKVFNQDILKMSNNILSSADRQSLSADSLLGSEHLILNSLPGSNHSNMSLPYLPNLTLPNLTIYSAFLS
jgi:hypothetical protein